MFRGKRAIRKALATLAVASLSIGISACGNSKDDASARIAEATKVAYPVTLNSGGHETVIEKRPERIVSLSPTATENLFAIQAGSQVIAVDEQSTFPTEAPKSNLSGFTPNVEAVLAQKPDLVVAQMDANGLVAGLKSAGVDVLIQPPAQKIDDIYKQIADLGAATDRAQQAADTSNVMRQLITDKVAKAGDHGKGKTYYHEVDNTLFSTTSASFIGSIYSLFGLQNIADAAATDGNQYPQLSSEFIVNSNPDHIFLANTRAGESKETLMKRPGWSGLKAITNNNVHTLDDDIASRWGPRTVDLIDVIATAVSKN